MGKIYARNQERSETSRSVKGTLSLASLMARIPSEASVASIEDENLFAMLGFSIPFPMKSRDRDPYGSLLPGGGYPLAALWGRVLGEDGGHCNDAGGSSRRQGVRNQLI